MYEVSLSGHLIPAFIAAAALGLVLTKFLNSSDYSVDLVYSLATPPPLRPGPNLFNYAALYYALLCYCCIMASAIFFLLKA